LEVEREAATLERVAALAATFGIDIIGPARHPGVMRAAHPANSMISRRHDSGASAAMKWPKARR
jgi:hypothetical protein